MLFIRRYVTCDIQGVIEYTEIQQSLRHPDSVAGGPDYEGIQTIERKLLDVGSIQKFISQC
jgi:hypothetical protein